MIGLGDILAALNILEKLGKYRATIRGKSSIKEENVASRFVSLFESHGVHRNQIPRFFGHGLSVKDVQDDASLLPKLDETLLDDACKLFAIRREWLDGADSMVYVCHDFYKYPQQVADFLKLLKDANPDGGLGGVLIAPVEHDGVALLVLSEVVGAVGERAIYRYHLCNNWYFEYWKSRAYLAAFIAISWRNAVYINGRFAPKRDIERIAYGDTLLDSSDGYPLILSGPRWDPEDMALRPEIFLKGIDPEQSKFGFVSALELWLTLEEHGHMATGLAMYRRPEVRQRFQQELDKLQKA